MFFIFLFIGLCCASDCVGRSDQETNICAFPYWKENSWQWSCLKHGELDDAPHGVCPTSTDPIDFRPKGTWKPCSCNTTCPPFSTLEVEGKYWKGSLDVAKENPILAQNCTWQIENPVYLNSPTTLIIFPEDASFTSPNASFSISTHQGELLGVIRANSGPFPGLWTKDPKLIFQLYSAKETTSLKAVTYTGFCSAANGTMRIPTNLLKAGFHPKRPLISSNYNSREGGGYRKNAQCRWIIDSPEGSTQTIYFPRFRLQRGDEVQIRTFSRDSETAAAPNRVETYSNVFLPQLFYTRDRVEVLFSTKSVDPRYDYASGFEAEVLLDSCRVHDDDYFSQPFGVISDGTSKETPLNPNLDCSWTLFFSQEISISLNFSYFNLVDAPGDLNDASLTIFAFNLMSKRPTKPLQILKGNLGSFVSVYKATGLRFVLKTPKNKTEAIGAYHGFEFSWKACVGRCAVCQSHNSSYDWINQTCVDCWDVHPKGTLVWDTNSTLPSCVPCPPGSHRFAERSNVCVQCAAGFFEDGGSCSPCAPHSIAPHAGSANCTLCHEDETSENNLCVACKNGTSPNRGKNGCSKVRVARDPQVILIYSAVGLGAMCLIGGLIAFFQWRNSQNNNDYQLIGMSTY